MIKPKNIPLGIAIFFAGCSAIALMTDGPNAQKVSRVEVEQVRVEAGQKAEQVEQKAVMPVEPDQVEISEHAEEFVSPTEKNVFIRAMVLHTNGDLERLAMLLVASEAYETRDNFLEGIGVLSKSQFRGLMTRRIQQEIQGDDLPNDYAYNMAHGIAEGLYLWKDKGDAIMDCIQSAASQADVDNCITQ